MGDQPFVPRGRGAFIAALLAKKREDPGYRRTCEPTAAATASSIDACEPEGAATTPRPREIAVVPVNGAAALVPEKLAADAVIEPIKSVDNQPPMPRGRAHVLDQIKKMRELKIGVDPATKQIPTSDRTVCSTPKPTTKEGTSENPMPVQITKDWVGTSGKYIPASANYIILELIPDYGIYQYEVIFKPNIDSETARFKLVNSIILEYSKSKTFDGHILFLPIKICDDSISFDAKHPYDGSLVTMKIVYKKQVPHEENTTLFNLLFNRVMRVLKYKRVRRSYYDEKHPVMIPQHKLEIWPGFVTTVCKCSGGLMLCLDVSHRLLRTQTVFEFMTETIQMHKQHAKEVITKAVVGSVVLTHYNNRSYVVHDISWDLTPKSEFQMGDKGISFADYYKNHHNIDILDYGQPILINRKTVRKRDERAEEIVGLVPELCYMTGMTDSMRADHRIMKDVAQYTRITPQMRINALRKFVLSVRECKEAEDILSGWGLRLGQATIDLEMRVLNPETIMFGRNVAVPCNDRAEWNSAVMKNNVLSAVDLFNWLVIFTKKDDRVAKLYIENAMRLGPRMGISVIKPMTYVMPDDRTETYVKVLREKINQELQIVVVICPTIRDDRYTAIKRICCKSIPVASQVINSRTLQNPSKLAAIVQKIQLQMNCKLGGTLWSVKFPFKKWMICGIDVYHTSGQATNRAVCGFVGSQNDSITRWYSTVTFHSGDKEISEHIKPMFIKCINEFRHNNAVYPSVVIVFRDGVGDGQLNTCMEYEAQSLSDIAKEKGLDIKFIFIVVQKRINTRIFTKRSTFENPPPGSIIDTVITRPHYFDYFLVPQQVGQGTVTPTHYIVLMNEPNLKADYIQRLSFKLCHMYFNWSGTVRVPAPCQYAHKLAYLVGAHIHAPPDEQLCGKLFYL